MRMPLRYFHTCAFATAALAAFLCCTAGAQETPRKDPKAAEAKGLPPRPGPAEYQGVAKAGSVTLAADFAAHGVPTADGVFSNEEYVVTEVALYGPSGAHLNVSYRDFSLKINGKKVVQAQPYEVAFSSTKDPEWVPPGAPESKSKTSLGGGGQGEPPPAPAKMPMNLVLAMEQKIRKAALPEGDRPLPEAGLVFFQYGGKQSGIKTVELMYNGAAGKATLTLH